MEIVLMTITGASLAMALAMGAVLARMVREERRRAEARVAALVEMSGQPPVRPAGPRVTGISPTGEVLLSRDTAVAAAASREAAPPPAVPRPVVSRQTPAAPSPMAEDLDLRPSAPAGVEPPSMFAERERSSPWIPRLAAAAAFVALVGVVGYGLLPSRAAETAIDIRTAPDPAPAAAAAPLELLALRHSSERGTLAVSGLVHNPRSAGARTGIVATLFAFAADGSLAASGQAPLDYTTLGPGEESPFVVTIPVTAAVARYRIGFRAGDGAVIAHVDKRPLGEAVARR
jgi:hypothetical protein